MSYFLTLLRKPCPEFKLFSLHNVVTMRNSLPLQQLYSFNSLCAINFGHISDRFKPLWQLSDCTTRQTALHDGLYGGWTVRHSSDTEGGCGLRYDGETAQSRPESSTHPATCFQTRPAGGGETKRRFTHIALQASREIINRERRMLYACSPTSSCAYGGGRSLLCDGATQSHSFLSTRSFQLPAQDAAAG